MKIMMYGHGGSMNRGCEAIVRSSASIIKEGIGGAQVYLLSDNPHTDQSITKLDDVYDGSPSPLRKYSYDWLVSSVRNKLFQDESYALGKIHDNIIRHIDHMDVCLSIGGDNYCYGEQPGWYEVNRRVKRQGKKLVLWGCSIGEEDMSPAKLQDLAGYDLILARETLTYEMLKAKGLTNVRLVADPAFTMEKEELALPEGWQEGNTVGLNFSPLVWKRNEQSKAAVHELIRHMLDTTDMAISLTPHVMQEGNNDYEVLQTYYEEYKHTGRVLLLPDHLNAIQYKGYIARMRFFIGARTHATIAAYSNAVPTLVLGYSVKSKGIAKDLFGEEKLVLGIQDISSGAKLKGAFDEMVRDEAVLREALRGSVPRLQQLSHRAVQYLAELA
ncbi:polysaccharide pyruvyl transferase family protein [Paenibacillus sp. 1011MAR3C5]|uniref:polysaccharide pyruvyl transferase family protein n=1 Tax=Paenibacillus sp. 1011MAR3C5 TaxID=1675787 RepID=UPI000E6BAE25|nr:polysaccharide pyruvyl transferase family protein [Paenibacillus sp. 1011MAR3C5]RJE91150.1 polysaccharide pyruvyl transferase family protein [Paenibacillus sp. 1011MAR3C5]